MYIRLIYSPLYLLLLIFTFSCSKEPHWSLFSFIHVNFTLQPCVFVHNLLKWGRLASGRV